MAMKWRCTACGYIHEGAEAPAACPLCKVPANKFVEYAEASGALEFVTEHKLGDANGASEELMSGLKAHFSGECSEVGQYLAMSRQADREVTLRLQRLSSVTLLRRLSTQLSSQSFWARLFGIQRLTSSSV